MKHLFKPRVSGLLMTFLLFAGGTQTALALGTPSDTTISNTATVTYQSLGIDQTPVLSSPDGLTPAGITTDFLVDNKVDVVVTRLDGAYVPVTPGLSDQVLTFLVRNDGNTSQDFSLVAAAAVVDPFGGTESFDTTGVGVFVEDGTTPGSYQIGEDTATFIEELPANGTATVYVVSDIPVALINGDIAAYTLTADAHDADNVTPSAIGAETVDLGLADTAFVDVVLADIAGITEGARSGGHSDASAYQVETATLVVTKISAVNWDPFNLFVIPKAIPGARILYTITVENTGVATTATSVVITDAMPVDTAYFPSSITLGGVGKTDAAADDEAEFNIGSDSVIVTVASLAAGVTATITFEVTID